MGPDPAHWPKEFLRLKGDEHASEGKRQYVQREGHARCTTGVWMRVRWLCAPYTMRPVQTCCTRCDQAVAHDVSLQAYVWQ